MKNSPPILVAAAAALCSTDGATTLVPQFLMAPDEIDDRISLFRTLAEKCSEPGYEKALAAMDVFEGATKIDVPSLLQFLTANVEVEDIQWASIRLKWSAGGLAEKGLSPKPETLSNLFWHDDGSKRT